MATGSYKIWPADTDGVPLDLPPESATDSQPNPSDERAVEIYFGLDPAAPQPPPKEQVELQTEIENMLRIVRKILIAEDSARNEKFRFYYMRMFRLAQVGLEGSNASPETARTALTATIDHLIDDEGARVKNAHLQALGKLAALLALPFLILYALFRLLPKNGPTDHLFTALAIHPEVIANFMLLWTGCLLGVWLSYGIRTTTLSLSDLVGDSDRLLPVIRLAFAGLLTMILGIFFVLGVVEIKLGGFSITDISKVPMLAFLVGVLCGISELALPASIAKRASSLVGESK